MNRTSRKKVLLAIKIGLLINITLTILKIVFGFFGNAQALISDGINSLTDVFVSALLFIALNISTKRPDEDHHYGHEKYEGLAYFFLGIVFFITAGIIIYSGVVSWIRFYTHPELVKLPQIYTVFIAFLAVSAKVFLYLYYRKLNKTYEHPTLIADAKNHLLDAYASFFSVIGLLLAQFNMIYFDYVASIIIGLFIIKLSITILKDSVSFLVDQAPSEDKIQSIENTITENMKVLTVDDLKVRKHMHHLYVDVEISVDANLTLEKAHQIAEEVHMRVEKTHREIIHCMVHVNPYSKNRTEKD